MKREGFNVIGKDGQRDKQSVEIVTGKIEMADDVWMGKKLFADQLGSKYAHCKVVSIDASKALALPGVVAVMDHTEIPGWSENKFFIGEGVAVVAATSINKAHQALELIDVEYEVRPHVIDAEAAMKSGAPLTGLWPEGNTDVRTELTREGSDLEKAFSEADIDFESDDGYTNAHAPLTMGGGSVTAWWNGDILNIWADTQNIHSESRGAAGSFNLPYNKVRGSTRGNGAGFGSGRAPVSPAACALAKKTGKVVSFHADRKVQQLTGGHQFKTKSHTRIGAKNDGTITALDFTYWADQGMNARAPMTGTHQCWEHIFPIPNAHFKGIGISTNTVNRVHYRCVAHPGGGFLMNLAINKLADELGMDYCDIRLKNMPEAGESPAMDQSPVQPYSLDTLKDRFREMMDIMDWDQKKHPNGQNNVMPDGRLHGIALTGDRDGHGGMGGGRGAILHMRPDGTCFVNPGMSRVGCGTNSAHCHIVAERLGINYEDVSSSYGDYHISADGGSQTGSSNTTRHGASFYVAASDAREQLLAQAATMFDPPVNPEDLDAAERKIFLKSDPTKFLTHTEVCARNPRIIGHASDNWGSNLVREHFGYPIGHPARQMPIRISGAEVAVDPETGEVEILRLVYMTDIGRIIFKDGAYGQSEAGLDHAVCQAMYWGATWDESTGYPLHSYWQVYQPTSLDLPLEAYQPELREGDSAVAVYGATGMGEPAAGNHNSINMAVSNAVGKYIEEGPLRPWIVLKALGKV